MKRLMLKLLLRLFGDELANEMRAEGYAYLRAKYGHAALHGIPGERPGFLMPEEFAVIDFAKERSK